MSEYSITLERSPGLSDGEIRARLSRVYRLLLQLAEKRATADGDSPGREAPSAVSTSDASRCRLECTMESARAQVAEG